jgi:predicted short-subunit dehydrogenase-like oxidoreductase (DUF2520 family)
MASPHLVALFDLAVELLNLALQTPQDSQKISHDARLMLLPLVMSTITNVAVSGPSQALTGTFARGDVETVKHHLKALSSGNPAPPSEALQLYKLLGLRSLELAKQHGLDPKRISEITKLLKASKPSSR